jgi:hypothetical protein
MPSGGVTKSPVGWKEPQPLAREDKINEQGDLSTVDERKGKHCMH